MASRPRGYGLTAEVKGKIDAKYEVDKEQEARLWIEAILGQPVDPSVDSSEPLGAARFHAALKDGTILCKLANAIIGNVKFNNMKVPFKQMENINNFLSACEKYGVAKTDLFQTVDLYESQNMWQVVLCLFALGRKSHIKSPAKTAYVDAPVHVGAEYATNLDYSSANAQANGYSGPALGPREAQRNTRDFSEEQLKAGQNVIGLQMGTNKMASQKGMSFGGQRHIADIPVDEASKEGQAVIGLQMGSNQGASQKGMSFGGQRHIADLPVDEASREGQAVIGLQMGSNQGATQAGQNFGKSRGIMGSDK